jgi:ribose transport system ATP-binding protein
MDADGQTAALALSDLSKTFNESQVLSSVSLSIQAGEIRALVGENGSGKSTLIKVLSGYHQPDPGATISINGMRLPTGDPAASRRAGLRFVHQDLGLISSMNSVDNLAIGVGYSTRGIRPIRWAARRLSATEALAQLGYSIDVSEPVGNLRASEKTALAVARALSGDGKPIALVLDEPTASLPGPEVERLLTLIESVRARGVAVLFVSHHISEVISLADSVTVLRNGRVVADRGVNGLDEDNLIELMVGHPVERIHAHRGSVISRPVLQCTAVGGRHARGLDLEVRSGEIVGIAGITGSGRDEVAALIWGASDRSGSVRANGRDLPPGRPDLSASAGMGYVPANRAANAVLHGHNVRENMSISRLRPFIRSGILSRKLERADTNAWLELVDVRPRRTEMPIEDLSGGNAQKVVLTRWLRVKPRILILDEPTQGVDVGSKEEIHRYIERAALDGTGVLLVSSESEELARVCDRVLVLVGGRIKKEFRRPVAAESITAATLTSAVPSETSSASE